MLAATRARVVRRQGEAQVSAPRWLARGWIRRPWRPSSPSRPARGTASTCPLGRGRPQAGPTLAACGFGSRSRSPGRPAVALPARRPGRRDDASRASSSPRLDPGALARLSRRAARTASRSSPRRTARRPPPRWPPRSSAARVSSRAQPGRARTSSPGSPRPSSTAAGRELAPASRSTRARFSTSRAQVQPAGRLPRRTSSATSSTATASSSSSPSAGAPRSPRCRPARVVVRRTPTTRCSAALARGRARSRSLRARRPSRSAGAPARTRPTRSTASTAARPSRTRPPTSAISATTAAPSCGLERPPLDVAARSLELERARRDRVRSGHARRQRARRAAASRVSTTSTTRSPPRPSRARSARPRRDRRRACARFRPAFGRFERIRAGDRDVLCCWSRTPPARTRRCARSSPAARRAVAVIALNDEIADGRDVSWIWDVDFEPLAAGLERLVAIGERAEELALRFKYGGLDDGPDRGRPRPRRARSTAASSSFPRAASCPCCRPTPRCSRSARSRSRGVSSTRTGGLTRSRIRLPGRRGRGRGRRSRRGGSRTLDGA